MQILWMFVLVALMGISLRFIRLALIFYLIGALVFPSLWFGEVALRFELIYCLWLVFVLFLRRATSGFVFRWNPVLSEYGLFLVIIIFSTMLALVDKTSKDSLMQIFILFYGILHPLLVMFLFLNISIDEKFVRRILWAFVWLSVPIALLSISQTLGLGIAQKITLWGYTSPWRTPVFGLLEKQGVIIRSTGVFESPVYNAVYFLLVLITIGFILIRQSRNFVNRWVLYLLFGLLVIAGVSTLTSTFLLGLIVNVGMLVFFLWSRYPKRLFRFAMGSILVFGLLITFTLPYFMQKSTFAGTLAYQVNRIFHGMVFSTRYDPTSGILSETYVAIQERPILGWGLIQIEDVFVGDSIYISVLYQGGIIGLSIFLWMIYGILKHAWRSRNQFGAWGEVGWMTFLWTLLLLATGLSCPSFFILRLEEWYWALVGLSLNPSFRLFQSGVKHTERG